MKLHYLPGTCSIGIHALLAEIGKPFEISEAARVGTADYDKYKAINPKGKVPALTLDDGSLLTEFPAIALYLARTNPERSLIASDINGEVRTLEMLDYLVSTVHMQGWTRVKRPGRFSPNEADHPAVQAAGLQIYQEGLQVAEKQLEGRRWLFDNLSICDFALFYLEFWSMTHGIGKLGPNCRSHYEQMIARTPIAQALAAEGFPLQEGTQ